MIQNSATMDFGGLGITCIHSNDHPNYSIVVVTTKPIFYGSPAQFEAMCESHQMLKDACKQFLNAWETIDPVEEQNAVLSAQEALRRAD